MIFPRRIWLLWLALALAPAWADQASERKQALDSLRHEKVDERFAAVVRLAELGTMEDAERLVPSMSDADPRVRHVAVLAMWQIWERSGDAAVDELYAEGVHLMQNGNLDGAVRIFTLIVNSKSDFAEAWNKRATAYFLLDQYELSMKDCDEVLKRNPNHFGAMSGYAQMLAELDQPERALAYLERAVKINPGLGSAQMIPTLKLKIEAKRRKST